MEKKYDVLCLGGLIQDFLVQPIPRDLFDYDGVRVESMRFNVGGDAANESTVMAKLGVKVILGTQAGDDDTGRSLIRYMESQGVDCGNVVYRGAQRTNVVLIEEDGQRHFIILAHKGRGFGEKEDFDYELLDRIRFISVGSIHIAEALDENLAEYFKAAKEKGVVTVADMVNNHGRQSLEDFKEIVKYTDYLIPSEIEAEELTGEKDPEKIADILLSWGPKGVIIKLGAEGCYIKNAEGGCYIKSFPVKAIDTTGAGDNFAAGFVTALTHDWTFRQCAEFASAVGSLSTETVGSTTGVQNFEQVKAFMQKCGRWDMD